MQKRSKRILAATLAAVGTVAAAGVAWAAFRSTGESQAVTVSGETFSGVEVSGAWLGRYNATTNTHAGSTSALIPGEHGDVKLTLTNPAANTINGKVVGIKAKPVGENDIGGAVSPGNKATCAGKLNFAYFTPFAGDAVVPVIADTGAGGAREIILRDAVQLDPSATEICQGMTFPVAYEVTFEATRDGVGGQSVYTPVPAPVIVP